MGEIEKYSTKFPFVFKGVITNSEQLGNFMYRYLGRCTGISHEALLMGGDLTAFSGGVKERVIVFKDPEDKSVLCRGIVSSCIWVFFWYNCFWWISVLYELILIFPILSAICQVTTLKTKEIRKTILASIISFIVSKILLIVIYVLYCLVLRLFRIEYIETSNGAGLMMILVTFIQGVSEIIAIVTAIIKSR